MAEDNFESTLNTHYGRKGLGERIIAALRETGKDPDAITADDLELLGSDLLPGKSALLFVGNNAVNGGSGNLFGDGLRCAGGGLIRLEIRFADGSGTSQTTIGIGAKGSVVPGDTKRYQCWYRTTVNPPCGLGVNDFNTSNGYRVTWLP